MDVVRQLRLLPSLRATVYRIRSMSMPTNTLPLYRNICIVFATGKQTNFRSIRSTLDAPFLNVTRLRTHSISYISDNTRCIVFKKETGRDDPDLWRCILEFYSHYTEYIYTFMYYILLHLFIITSIQVTKIKLRYLYLYYNIYVYVFIIYIHIIHIKYTYKNK